MHFGWGHGPGLLDFLWDVDLLGKRVAYYLSSENEEGWSALDDVRYDQQLKAELDELAASGQLGENVKWLM